MSDLTIIEKELTPVQRQIAQLDINTSESLITGTEYLSRINQYLDQLTEEKETLTIPLTATLKEIRARYKPAEELATLAKTTLTAKMARYYKALADEQQKQEQRVTAQINTGYLKKDTTIIRKMEAIPEAPKSATASSGSISFIDKPDFEVTDLSLVPIEYHLANEVMIRKVMKEGVQLPGIRYFTSQTIRNTR